MDKLGLVATIGMGLALLANTMAIRRGISMAQIEIFRGVITGNFFPIEPTAWINFVATFGNGLLTFLADAAVDPALLRLNNTDLGKLILAACFITELGTVFALGMLFANFSPLLQGFIIVSVLILWQMPRLTRWVITHIQEQCMTLVTTVGPPGRTGPVPVETD